MVKDSQLYLVQGAEGSQLYLVKGAKGKSTLPDIGCSRLINFTRLWMVVHVQYSIVNYRKNIMVSFTYTVVLQHS